MLVQGNSFFAFSPGLTDWQVDRFIFFVAASKNIKNFEAMLQIREFTLPFEIKIYATMWSKQLQNGARKLNVKKYDFKKLKIVFIFCFCGQSKLPQTFQCQKKSSEKTTITQFSEKKKSSNEVNMFGKKTKMYFNMFVSIYRVSFITLFNIRYFENAVTKISLTVQH